MEFLLTLGLLAVSSSILPIASAHSWNEQLSLVDDKGNFIANGYPRGYVARTDPGYNGNSMMWMLPSAESKRSRIDQSDFVCHTSQRTKTQAPNYPRLQVTPGSTVAMKYLENGHVTQPLNQKAKQPSGGSVFVFGTTQPKDDAKLMDVLKWTADGQGGDKSGRLIAAQNFDDGRCHQINSAPISVQRQAQWPNYKAGQTSGSNELWCETVVTLPKDIQAGQGAYTLYWVWDWRTANTQQAATLGGGQVADPGLPDGKDEFYTTCSDYDVVAQAPAPAPNQHTLAQQDPMASINAGAATKTALVANPGAEPSPNYGSAGSAPAAPGPASASAPASSPAPASPAAAAPSPVKPAASSSPVTPAPAPASVSPLGLAAFKPAPAEEAASSAPAPSAMTSNSPAPAAPSAGMKAITVPANAPVYVISAGSLVPVQRRAEPTPTTMASIVRRWAEGYSVEERARLAHKKRQESSGHYHAFGQQAHGRVHDHRSAHNMTGEREKSV